MPDSILDGARHIRGNGDYLLGGVDRPSVRAARTVQRTITIPVLSGLHSRDPQRKARLAWLETLHWERFLAGLVDRPPAERAEHARIARRAWELLKLEPWVPVLP